MNMFGTYIPTYLLIIYLFIKLESIMYNEAPFKFMNVNRKTYVDKFQDILFFHRL